MRFVKTTALALALAASVSLTAIAEVAPRSGPLDGRIRYIAYSKDDVVKVEASYGASTMIVFQEDEKIETLGAGDALAWKIEPNKKGNILFVKPVEKNAAANLNVITNKRQYVLLLRGEFRPVEKQIFKIVFRYPEDEADAKLLAEAQERAKAPNLRALDVANANSSYGYKGSPVNRPLAVFDDGKKTWWRFDGEVPSFFTVDDDRNESLVNFRREGEYLVVDKVSAQWTLRHGDEATCIFNLRQGNIFEPTGLEAHRPKAVGTAKARVKRGA
jgi:type IV secretion system protein VirB9